MACGSVSLGFCGTDWVFVGYNSVETVAVSGSERTVEVCFKVGSGIFANSYDMSS